jgi:hypothetical protein
MDVQSAVAIGKKMRRARRVGWAIAILPSIRMVAVCNSVAFGSAREESDIDLFIVTAPGTIAITRAIVTTALALTGLRPTPTKEKDAICASFFATTEALDMSKIALDGGDPYLAMWCHTLLPVAQRGETYNIFLRTNTNFITRELGFANANDIQSSIPPSWMISQWKENSFTRIAIQIFRTLEPLVAKIQQKIFPKEILDRMNKGSDVVVSSRMLKFHTVDRRHIFRDAWYTDAVCRSHSEQLSSSSSQSSRHLERV